MQLEDFMVDRPRYVDQYGVERWLIRPLKKKPFLFSWQRGKGDTSIEHVIEAVMVPIIQVPEEVLKGLSLWDKLDSRLQKSVQNFVVTAANQFKSDLEVPFKPKASKGKRGGFGRRGNPELVGVPRVLLCKCGKETHINPRTVIERAGEAGIPVEDWVAQFQCQKCRPHKVKGESSSSGGHRGRQADPRYIGLPRQMTCKCGKTTSIGPGLLVKFATAAGKTPQEYAASYLCRGCNPTHKEHMSKIHKARRKKGDKCGKTPTKLRCINYSTKKSD